MDLEIPVVFNGDQKWITGLSRSTTCDDVIYALLRHNQGPNESFDVSEYRMYEEWKDFSRTLSGRTRIVKLWRLLGSKARNIRLVIRLAPTTDVFDTGSEMSYNTRNRRAARRLSKNPSKHQPLSKADVYQYYKTKERSKVHSDSGSGSSNAAKNVEDVHSYVSMVSKQQRELDELALRNAAIDAHISNYEDLYQYPCDQALATSMGDTSLFPTLKSKDIETYLKMIEGILGLHEHVEQTHSKACYLASVVSEEQQALAAKRLSQEISDDIERTRQRLMEELAQCQALSQTQHNELHLLGNALQQCDVDMLERQQEFINLSKQLEEVESYEDSIQQEPHNQTHIQTHKDTSYTKPQLPKQPQSPVVQNTCHINNQQDTSRFPPNSYEKVHHNESTTHTGRYIQNSSKGTQNHHNNINHVQQFMDRRNESQTKLDNDRSKGVRFNTDVTKWMYDVLSEDESNIDGNNTQSSNNPQKDNQYTQHQGNMTHIPSVVQTQNTINTKIPSPPEQKRNMEFTYTGSGSFDPYIMPYKAHVYGMTCVGIDDSNSDTGLSSMNSEDDIPASPLETLV